MSVPTASSAPVSGSVPFAEPPASPVPRRLPVPGWLDLRLLAGIVLVLGSVLLGARVVAGARQTSPRVAVRGNLAAGTVLTAGDLGVVQVQLPAPAARAYVIRPADAIGRRLVRPLARGELLPSSALTAVGPRATISLPLERGSAPHLRRGDRIEVWLSSARCASVVLLPDSTVQTVHDDTSGSFGAGGDGQDIVLSVSPELAQRVVRALAIDDVRLRAAVLTGRATGSASPALPDLAACSAPAS